MIHNKICPICGVKFETRYKNQVYCSKLCACKSNNIRGLKYIKRVHHEPKACAECGKEFIPKNIKSKFCCKECKRVYYAKQPKKGFAPKKCEYCGKEFIPNSSSGKYCCEKCRKAGAKEAHSKSSVHTQNYTSEKTKARSQYPDVPASKRWEKMALAERNGEARKYHLSYGQAQAMAYCGTLPEDFGIKRNEGKNENKKDS